MLVTPDSFDDALEPFLEAPRLIYDTETTGLHTWLGDRVCGVALTEPSLQHVCYFPVRHEQGRNITPKQFRRLVRLLSNPHTIYTGWNIKFDLEMMMQDGMAFPELIEDVMLACHHLNENDKPFELKRWASKYIDPHAADAEAEMEALLLAEMKKRKLKGGKKECKKHISLLHPRDAEPYACDDVRYTERLRRLALPALKEWKTLKLWRESNEYLQVVAKMELRGFKLDVPLIHEYIEESKRQEKKAYRKLVKAAGYEINCGSPKQVQKFLGVTSSAKEILEELDDPNAESILSYRAWNKARTTYYERWLYWKDLDDILHPNLNLHRVVTGRQSASDPNTHGVPRYRPEYKVKDCVVARRGFTLVSADYNQAELRVGVSVAQEHNMAKIFLAKPKPGQKIDIHQAVADALGISRDLAKTINFMILYGGGEEKFARKAKIHLMQAREYLQRYHAEYWHFRHTSKFWTNRARYQGYIRLWSGRIRHFNHPLANPKDAFNSLVQGGVAEMLRYAILALDPIMPDFDAHMLLQIHDQIIFEVPTVHLEEVVPVIKATMEDFDHWMIPPKVDIKVGKRWGKLDDYELPSAKAA